GVGGFAVFRKPRANLFLKKRGRGGQFLFCTAEKAYSRKKDKTASKGKELMRGLISATVQKDSPLGRLWLATLLFVALAAETAAAQPQLPEPPLPVNPTPLSDLLSPAERVSVTQADNAKKKIDLYIHMGDTHLEAAGSAVKANNSAVAESELDIYNKAMAEASKLTLALQDGKRQVAKKLEQALYKQIRNLENIDRLFPTERIGFAEDALKR